MEFYIYSSDTQLYIFITFTKYKWKVALTGVARTWKFTFTFTTRDLYIYFAVPLSRRLP